MYNLLQETWMTARHASGKTTKISPIDVTLGSEKDGPLVELVAARGDFRAAHYQFLVGLLQTAMPPKNELAWRKRFENPPTRDELATAFRAFEPAFHLMDDKAPFMQESFLATDPAVRPRDDVKNVSGLRIESPGDDTIRKGKDFLEKSREDAYCRSCAASAVLALQTNAPSGGRGQMTSIRGGGPLTTLVVTTNLWQTLWLNVLPLDSWGEKIPSPGRDVFAWLHPWPVLKSDRSVTRANVQPAYHYWAMPRRVLLEWDSGSDQACTICGDSSPSVSRMYRSRPDGFQYSGGWEHPLSPWRLDKDNVITLKGNSTPTAYKSWNALVANNEVGKTRAARVVAHLRAHRSDVPGVNGHRLWVGGYDTDNAKINGWYEGTIPLHHVPPGDMDSFDTEVGRFISAADLAVYYLRTAAQSAWNHDSSPANKTRDPAPDFWRETEQAFYRMLSQTRETITRQQPTQRGREEWRGVLRNSVMAIFDRVTSGASIADGDAARIARARRDLIKKLGGKKLKQTLGIQESPEVAA